MNKKLCILLDEFINKFNISIDSAKEIESLFDEYYPNNEYIQDTVDQQITKTTPSPSRTCMFIYDFV